MKGKLFSEARGTLLEPVGSLLLLLSQKIMGWSRGGGGRQDGGLIAQVQVRVDGE